ncbi:MAG: pantoate--beta-alanine ligase [Clostridiaceae bacterium]|nr:pantoate--beta-alanine ligase [Clostridiaceae bacterium]
MKTVQGIKEVRKQVEKWRRKGLTIGMVPTMGFLHDGHESLINKARKENDKVIVSIFVNPTQFGPTEDFAAYPRDLKKDEKLCKRAGADLIFNPEASEIYIDDASTTVNVLGLSEGLCGGKRPVHFGGVCLVVSKLFNIATPDKAYFGEKDAQQLAVIKRMVRDLNFNVEIIGCPIIRELDGLAKSSRNTYLSIEERKAALILNKSLKLAKKAINKGENNSQKIFEIITNKIETETLSKIDYIEIVDSNTLKPIETLSSSSLIAIAVYIGKTRLIDNFTVEVK